MKAFKIFMFLVVVFIVASIAVMCTHPGEEKEPELPQPIYFNADAYVNISESELVRRDGEPDSIEDWVLNNKYPMRTYKYGDHDFEFVQKTDESYALYRIHLYEKIPYTNIKKIYELFNVDNPISYVDNGVVIKSEYNDGTKQIYAEHDKDNLTLTYLTYITGLL